MCEEFNRLCERIAVLQRETERLRKQIQDIQSRVDEVARSVHQVQNCLSGDGYPGLKQRVEKLEEIIEGQNSGIAIRLKVIETKVGQLWWMVTVLLGSIVVWLAERLLSLLFTR